MTVSFPPDSVNPLYVINALLNYRGALYEGDVFTVLSTSSYIVRSFELTLADGVIDCTYEYALETGFTTRLWDLDQRLRLDLRRGQLLLFDVKSKVSPYAGDQKYLTGVAQRGHVAFYIGCCVADPTSIELIPNFLQDDVLTGPSLVRGPGESREVAVN